MQGANETSTLGSVHADEDISITPCYDYDEEWYSFQKTTWERAKIIYIVICSLALVLGVAGNGLVIFITGFRMKKTVNTVWFLHLAIADFICISSLPLRILYVVLEFHWAFGQMMCKLNNSIVFLSLYASTYLLAVISVDPCLSLWYPAWTRNHRTPRQASFMALGVWTVALILWLPQFYFKDTSSRRVFDEDSNATVCFNNYGSTHNQAIFNHHAMVISQFTFAFVIPFRVTIACYVSIVLKLRRNRLTQAGKPFKAIVAVSVAFFACWFPYHIFAFLETRAEEEPELHLLLFIGVPLTSSLAFLNSCLKPILYVFVGHNFKGRCKCSLLSALEKSFTEDSSQSTTHTKAGAAVEPEYETIT